MIVSEQHGFVFVHIPKCAGSSVRRRLREVAEDQDFRSIVDHEALGRVHLAHLPLATLKQHFPDAFEKVQRLEAYAVLRDPGERFRSALSQRLKEFQNVELFTADDALIRRNIDEVMAELDKGDDLPPLEFVHFIPQHRFVIHDGSQVVEHLYPLERVSDMLADIGKGAGLDLAPPPKENETSSFRNESLRGPVRKVNVFLREWLPSGVYENLKGAAKAALTKDTGTLRLPALERPHVTAFIRDFYAEDFRLLEAARNQTPAG